VAVRELPAPWRLRGAVLDVIDVPLRGGVDDDVRADALFVSSIDSQAACGVPTGRYDPALQAQDRTMAEALHAVSGPAMARGGRDRRRTGRATLTPRRRRRLRTGSESRQHRCRPPRQRAGRRSAAPVTVEF